MARVHSCSLNRWNWECWNRMEQEHKLHKYKWHKPKRSCKVCKGWKIHAWDQHSQCLLYRIREVPMQVLQSSNVYTYSWSPVDYLRCFQRLFRHFTFTTSYFFNFCATRRSGAHFTRDSTPKVLMLGWALFVDLDESPARGDVNYFFARQRTLSCQCEAHKQIPKRLQQILLRRVRSNRCLSNWTHIQHLSKELRWYHMWIRIYHCQPLWFITLACCCHGESFEIRTQFALPTVVTMIILSIRIPTWYGTVRSQHFVVFT